MKPFEKISCLAWLSFLAFRYDDPTYYPSFITIYGNNVIRPVVVAHHCLACPQLN